MEWVEKLRGTIVGLDSAPLIYFVEEHPACLSLLDPFFEAVEQGEIQLVTSTLTLSEVLVYPIRRFDIPLVTEYSEILLNSPNLRTIPASPQIATDAAQLRATLRLRTPDAIQVATARSENATAFLTNDHGITTSSAMQLIVLDDLLANQRP